MIIAEVEINAEDLVNTVKQLVKETDTQLILDEASAVMLNRIRDRFLQQQAPDGSRWKPSKAAQRRAKKGLGGGTLFDTGRLFRSIQAAPVSAGASETTIRTDVPYARKHQYGEDGMPVRKFLGFNKDDADFYAKVLATRIESALK